MIDNASLPDRLVSEWYTFSFNTKHKDGKIRFSLEAERADQQLALRKEFRKLYVVLNLNRTEVYYVGEANTSIRERFNRGFVSYRYHQREKIARGGYQGYKWIDLFSSCEKLSVYVLCFPEESIQGDKELERRKYIQAIEGEFVYHVRNRTGKWPLYQNEIHFQENGLNKIYCEQLFDKFWEQTSIYKQKTV